MRQNPPAAPRPSVPPKNTLGARQTAPLSRGAQSKPFRRRRRELAPHLLPRHAGILEDHGRRQHTTPNASSDPKAAALKNKENKVAQPTNKVSETRVLTLHFLLGTKLLYS